VGVAVGLILIAVGAVLALAVHQHPGAAVDVHVVGWVLLAVGFFGILLSLVWWDRFGPGYWGWRRTTAGPYDPLARAYTRRGSGYGGRRTVVEEEGPVGPGNPYDAPPPP
jgi:hypothetical protein